RQPGRARQIAARQDHQEFLATIAANRVVGAQNYSKTSSGFSEYRVSCRVAKGVIDTLEMVELPHGQTDRLVFAPAARKLMSQDLEDSRVVPQAGQRIVSRLSPELFADL